jgi:hypothetical protein
MVKPNGLGGKYFWIKIKWGDEYFCISRHNTVSDAVSPAAGCLATVRSQGCENLNQPREREWNRTI